jgi:hypothetical protein
MMGEQRIPNSEKSMRYLPEDSLARAQNLLKHPVSNQSYKKMEEILKYLLYCCPFFYIPIETAYAPVYLFK